MFKCKYYHAENSNRVIVSNRIGFNFEPVQRFGGTWRGIFEAKTQEHADALDALVKDPKSAVTELTEEEYRKKKKSAPQSEESYQPLPQQGNTGDQRVIPGTAVLVETPGPENQPEPKVEMTGEPVENLEKAIKVGPVRKAK